MGMTRTELTGMGASDTVSPMKPLRAGLAAAAVVLAGATLLAGCSTPPPAEPPPPAGPTFRPVATVREVMNSIIDPSIDVVWNSVGTQVDAKGLLDRAPANDEEWAEVRRHALVVSEAANLLLMRDRPIAHPGEPSLAPGVELTPEEIRALIDQNPEGWDFYVNQFQDSVRASLAAIDKKDAQGLFDNGEKIDVVCENCHATFWYPSAVAAAK